MLLTILDLRGKPYKFDLDVLSPATVEDVWAELSKQELALPLLPEHGLYHQSTRLDSGSLLSQGIEDFAVIILRAPAVTISQDQLEESQSEDDGESEMSDDSWFDVNCTENRSYAGVAKELKNTKMAFEMLAREYSKERQSVKKKENKESQDPETSQEQDESLKTTLRMYEEGVQDADFLLEKSLPFRRLAFRDFVFSKSELILGGTDVSLESLNADLTRFLNDPEVDRFTDLPEFWPRAPDERQYVNRLNELKNSIGQYVPRNVPFTIEVALSLLKEVSPMGAETVRFVEHRNLLGVFKSKRRMKQLMTHILCLAFHERILSPFVPGVDAAFSRKLYLLQNYIITRDATWQEIIGAKRILGMAAIQNMDHIAQLQTKLAFAQELNTIINLPDPGESLLKLIDLAADIRKDIATERALYSPLWPSTDGRLGFDSDFARYDGWSDEAEPLPLCVGWGLSETTWLGDGFIKEICIAPAEIQLD